MAQPTTSVAAVPAAPSTAIWPHLGPLVDHLATTARQPRTRHRARTLTDALTLAFGRRTLTQVLLAAGQHDHDWSAAYRLFRTPLLDQDAADAALAAEVLAHHPPIQPVPVVLDGTQLPRASPDLVGTGWGPAPRSPVWRRGLHRAQRWVGLSALLPRSLDGSSRCVPLRFLPAPTPSATPWPDHPPQREWQAGLAHLHWLRDQLDRASDEPGRATQRLLALADGSYGGAGMWQGLPHDTTLLVRCPRNRALFALPDPPAPGTRGRQRRYGTRGLTPQAQLTAAAQADGLGQQAGPWRRAPVAVRGRPVPLTYRLSGPWLVKPAWDVPLVLLTVRGIQQRRRGRRVQRAPTFLLVNVVVDATAPAGWRLPLPAAELLAWAWQRWEVEVLHKELKSGFGLGEQQAWHPVSAERTPRWVAWTVGCLVLAGYRAWGWDRGPPHRHGRWWRPRRWTARDVAQAARLERLDTSAARPPVPPPVPALRADRAGMPSDRGGMAPGGPPRATRDPAQIAPGWRVEPLVRFARRI